MRRIFARADSRGDRPRLLGEADRKDILAEASEKAAQRAANQLVIEKRVQKRILNRANQTALNDCATSWRGQQENGGMLEHIGNCGRA